MDTPEHKTRQQLDAQYQSYESSNVGLGIIGSGSIISGSGLLHAAKQTKNTWHKVLGVGGIVLGAVSALMIIINHRYMKQTENQIKQIDEENRSNTPSFSIEVNGGHVQRLQEQEASQEITRS